MNIDRDKLIDERKAPFSNCSFELCDLIGQCKSEGKCHHPLKISAQAITSMQTEQPIQYLLRIDCEGDVYKHIPCADESAVWQAIKEYIADTNDADDAQHYIDYVLDGENWVGDSCHYSYEIGSWTLYKFNCDLFTHPAPVTSMQGDSEPVKWGVLQAFAVYHSDDLDSCPNLFWLTKEKTAEFRAKESLVIKELCLADRVKGVSDTNTDGWVSVETKEPAIGKDCLAFDGRHIFMASIFDGDGFARWIADGEDEDIEPTHWQPLPAPPAISQDKGESV